MWGWKYDFNLCCLPLVINTRLNILSDAETVKLSLVLCYKLISHNRGYKPLTLSPPSPV